MFNYFARAPWLISAALPPINMEPNVSGSPPPVRTSFLVKGPGPERQAPAVPWWSLASTKDPAASVWAFEHAERRIHVTPGRYLSAQVLRAWPWLFKAPGVSGRWDECELSHPRRQGEWTLWFANFGFPFSAKVPKGDHVVSLGHPF